jgi:hypothetical protein
MALLMVMNGDGKLSDLPPMIEAVAKFTDAQPDQSGIAQMMAFLAPLEDDHGEE